MGWSAVEVKCALKIFGPQRLEDGRVTKRGVHMGLAGTWAILNIANEFAASRATVSCSPRNRRQCGDDLIALFNDAEREEYRHVLEEDLHLKYNLKKSYIGESGRFCENYVKIVHRDEKEVIAVCSIIPKIAEVVAARELNGFSDSPVNMVTGLAELSRHSNRVIRRGASMSLKLLEYKLGLVPNLPLCMGGSGRVTKRCDSRQKSALMRYIRTAKGLAIEGRLPAEISAQLNDVPEGTTNGQVKVSEYRVHKLSMLSEVERLENGKTIMRFSDASNLAIKRRAIQYSTQKSYDGWSPSTKFNTKFQKFAKDPISFLKKLKTGKCLRKFARYAIISQKYEYYGKAILENLVSSSWSMNKKQDGSY